MKPAPFDYLRPDTVEEALAALAERGEEARILAGGQSLMAILNLRMAEPSLLIDIGRIEALSAIRRDGAMVEIGAAVTQADLLAWPDIGTALPLVAAALAHVGHFQTRNRGTVCGSIAHADPSAELPLCLATLRGEVVLRSAKGRRTVAASEFQTGLLSTARGPDEMVVAARFPAARPNEGFAFAEVARRPGDFAVTAAAAQVSNDTLRLGIGGVASRPEVREWTPRSPEALAEALNAFAWELDAADDLHASARYRRELVRRLGRRVAEEAGLWNR